MLEFTFLGTSSGTPSRTRNVSGLAVRMATKRDWFLIDAGEATQHRLLSLPLSLQNLAAILITHAHGDHCYGLPGLLASMAMDGRRRPLTIWGPRAVLDWLARTFLLTEEELPFALEYRATENEKTLPWDEHLVFHARPLRHRVVTHAFEIGLCLRKRRLDIEALRSLGIPQGPLWKRAWQGETIVIGERSIPPDAVSAMEELHVSAICGGDNAEPEMLAPYVEGLDLLIHEATYSEAVARRLGPAPMHSSAERIARFAAARGIPHLALTHFSPRHHGDMDALEAEARRYYAGHLILAADGMRCVLDGHGRLSCEEARQEAEGGKRE
jgi:ribonuclease Z